MTFFEKIKYRKRCSECSAYNPINAECTRFDLELPLWRIIGKVECKSFSWNGKR